MKAGALLKKQKDRVLPLVVDEDDTLDELLKKVLLNRSYEIIYVRDKDKNLCGYIPTKLLIKHYAWDHIITPEEHAFAGKIFHFVTSSCARDIMTKAFLYCHEHQELTDILRDIINEEHPFIIAVFNDADEHVGFLDLLDMVEQVLMEKPNRPE